MLEHALADLGDTIARGGFVMWPLVGSAAVLWYALGHRLLLLRRGAMGPIRALVARGAGVRPRGVIGGAVARALAVRDQLGGRARHLRGHLDVALGEYEDQLGRLRALVRAIVAVAPLTGLLGTVIGMMETFDALGDMALFTQSGGIAGGISQALLTTQMGLAVAIPGLVVGKLLDRRQQRLEGELAELKDVVCSLDAEAAA